MEEIVTEEVLPIGTKQVQEAFQLLQKYRSGKCNLEKRIVENQQWYKLRHWDCLRSKTNQIQPVSGWLFNAIANKHADAMDNYPSPNVLPREASDRPQAKMLSAVLPVILEHSDFEEVYHRVWDSKLIAGTGIYGVFWDRDKLGGMGDVSVTRVDPLNLYWQSGISDIQKSKNLFYVELQDDEALLATYPNLTKKLLGNAQDLCRYLYDDSVDTTGQSLVVDWYYKKQVGRKKLLHYCKFVGETVLYSSENDPLYADRGWYDHGKYPFVFDPLFRTEGSPCGFGYIDIGKSAQEYIDRGNQAVLQNMLANARPRYFIRSDGAVNEQEFADLSKDFIHVDGNLGQDSVLPVRSATLEGSYLAVIEGKIQELKEVTGNRDVSTGGTSGGVTAASAIAAMQEAGSKLSRDSNKAAYRAFRQVCLMIIELVRQFYDLSRCFRIAGSAGEESYVNFSNGELRPRYLGPDPVLGLDQGWYTPIFDVEVAAQKQSPYTKMGQNELALQLYGAGFFHPENAGPALACLDMMDFDRKDILIQAIRANRAPEAVRQNLGEPALSGEKSVSTSAMDQARRRTAEATAPR